MNCIKVNIDNKITNNITGTKRGVSIDAGQSKFNDHATMIKTNVSNKYRISEGAWFGSVNSEYAMPAGMLNQFVSADQLSAELEQASMNHELYVQEYIGMEREVIENGIYNRYADLEQTAIRGKLADGRVLTDVVGLQSELSTMATAIEYRVDRWTGSYVQDMTGWDETKWNARQVYTNANNDVETVHPLHGIGTDLLWEDGSDGGTTVANGSPKWKYDASMTAQDIYDKSLRVENSQIGYREELNQFADAQTAYADRTTTLEADVGVNKTSIETHDGVMAGEFIIWEGPNPGATPPKPGHPGWTANSNLTDDSTTQYHPAAGSIKYATNSNEGHTADGVNVWQYVGGTLGPNSNGWEKVNEGRNDSYIKGMLQTNTQIDSKVETWYYNYVPTTGNEPASNWNSENIRVRHLGDLFYNTTTNRAYRYVKSGNDYSWAAIVDEDITNALANASTAQDTADGKRTIFYNEGVPPATYTEGGTTISVKDGDLWIPPATFTHNGTEYVGKEIYRWLTDTWLVPTRYTNAIQAVQDGLNTWRTGDYANDLAAINASVDQKAESYYQAAMPYAESIGVDATTVLDNRVGDVWMDSDDDNRTYVHSKIVNTNDATKWDYKWVEEGVPKAVFDEYDGRATVYTGDTEPVGMQEKDLWITGDNPAGGRVAKEIYTYNGTTWLVPTRYTEDLTNFTDGAFHDLTQQVDRKIEYFFCDAEYADADAEISHIVNDTTDGSPHSADWNTAAIKRNHRGDVCYFKRSQRGYDYDSDTNLWTNITNSGVIQQLAQVSDTQAAIDRKIVVFSQDALGDTGAEDPALVPAGTAQNPLGAGDLWVMTDAYAGKATKKYNAVGDLPATGADNTVYIIKGTNPKGYKEWSGGAYVTIDGKKYNNRMKAYNLTDSVWSNLGAGNRDSMFGWASGASKLIKGPGGEVTGWSMGDGSDIQSTFAINANVFRISDSTNSVIPFSIDATDPNNPKVNFLGTVTFDSAHINGIPTHTSGTLADRPATAVEGSTYTNTDTNPHSLYTYTSGGWVAGGNPNALTPEDIGANGTTVINGDLLSTGTILLGRLNVAVVANDYNGTVLDRNGIRIYDSGVCRVKLGKI